MTPPSSLLPWPCRVLGQEGQPQSCVVASAPSPGCQCFEWRLCSTQPWRAEGVVGGVRWGPRRSCGGLTRGLALLWTPWLWGVSIPDEAWPWGMFWRGLRGLRRVTLGHSLSPCNCCRRGPGHPLPMVEHSALQKGSSRGPVLPPSSHCSWALVTGSSVASVLRPQFLPLLQSAPSLPCASACSGAAFLEEVGHGPQAPQRQARTGVYRRV